MCRSLGIGRRLYEMFFEQAKREGRTTVKAITAPINTGSIAFHRRLGFSVSEPIENYDRPGTAHVVFARPL